MIKKTISAGMITTTPSWRRLLTTVSNRSTYRIIHRLQFREIGYLYLLEKIISPPRFRQLCPLVVPINADLADYVISQTSEAFLKTLLHSQDQRKLYRLLWRHYYYCQRHLAKHSWPTDIGDCIDAFLDQVGKLTAISPEEWYLCRLYLDIKYGLSGNPPVNKEKEILNAVLQKADIDSPNFNKAAINQWDAKAHNALASSTVLPHLETIAGAFHSSHRAKWTHFLKLTGSPKEYSDLSFNSSLPDLISLRVANALEKRGIYILGDLEGVTEEHIKSIPNLGNSAVAELKSALRQVKQAIEQRTRIQLQELKQ